MDFNSYAGKSGAMCRLYHTATPPGSNIHMLYTSITRPAQKSATKRKKERSNEEKKRDEIHLLSVNKPINPAALLVAV